MLNRRLLGLAASVVLQQVALPVGAQSAPPPGSFRQIDQHGTGAARIRLLCGAEAALDAEGLTRLQDRLAEQQRARMPTDSLRKLGCVRSLLFAVGARNPGAVGTGVGESWASAAVAVLQSELDRDPGDARSAELLGIIVQEAVTVPPPVAPDPSGERGELKANVLPDAAAELYRAILAGANSAGLFRSCASLMLAAADLPAAHDCSVRALAAGHDSTWHLLRLAAMAFQRGDTTAGVAFLRHAALAAHDSVSREEIAWHLVPAAIECRGCIVAGALDPTNSATNSGALYKSRDLLTPAERAMLFAVPDTGLFSWLRQVIEGRGSIREDRLHRLADPQLSEELRRGSPLVQAFVAHFWYTSYGGGTFRGCFRNLDTVSCNPSRNPDDAHRLVLVATRRRVWVPATSQPVELVAYGLSLRNVDFPADGQAHVNLDFREWSLNGAAGRDTAFSREIDRPANSLDQSAYLGLAVLPVSPAEGWSLMATQPALRQGGVFADDEPPPAPSPIDASDLVLGVPGQQLVWSSGTQRVLVAPVPVFDRRDNPTLYFQMLSPRATAATMSIGIRSLDAGTPVGGPLVSLSYSTDLRAGVTEEGRNLDLSRLPAGGYELDLTVTESGKVVARRSVRLTLY